MQISRQISLERAARSGYVYKVGLLPPRETNLPQNAPACTFPLLTRSDAHASGRKMMHLWLNLHVIRLPRFSAGRAPCANPFSSACFLIDGVCAGEQGLNCSSIGLFAREPTQKFSCCSLVRGVRWMKLMLIELAFALFLFVRFYGCPMALIGFIFAQPFLAECIFLYARCDIGYCLSSIIRRLAITFD
jgi:hypothetical protein